MKGITDMTYTKKTTENLRRLAALSEERNGITPDMYTEHAVFRGLRDMSGNGVVTGLTEISTIKAKEKETDGTVHSCPGELYYRGYNIRDLVGGFSSENRFGFEEITYLLLFSSLPNKEELQLFEKMLTMLHHYVTATTSSASPDRHTKEEISYVITCAIGSTIGVLHKWTRDNFDLAPEVIAEILTQIFLSGMLPLLS